MLAILRVTSAKTALAALLRDMSMKPYRVQDKAGTADTVHLHFEILKSHDTVQEAVAELVSNLIEWESDLKLLRDSGSKMTLDCGTGIRERDYSKSIEFSAELLSILSSFQISLTISFYKTEDGEATPSHG